MKQRIFPWFPFAQSYRLPPIYIETFRVPSLPPPFFPFPPLSISFLPILGLICLSPLHLLIRLFRRPHPFLFHSLRFFPILYMRVRGITLGKLFGAWGCIKVTPSAFWIQNARSTQTIGVLFVNSVLHVLKASACFAFAASAQSVRVGYCYLRKKDIH